MYLGEKVPCLGSDVGRNPDGDSRRVRPLKRSLLLDPLARGRRFEREIDGKRAGRKEEDIICGARLKDVFNSQRGFFLPLVR